MSGDVALKLKTFIPPKHDIDATRSFFHWAYQTLSNAITKEILQDEVCGERLFSPELFTGDEEGFAGRMELFDILLNFPIVLRKPVLLNSLIHLLTQDVQNRWALSTYHILDGIEECPINDSITTFASDLQKSVRVLDHASERILDAHAIAASRDGDRDSQEWFATVFKNHIGGNSFIVELWQLCLPLFIQTGDSQYIKPIAKQLENMTHPQGTIVLIHDWLSNSLNECSNVDRKAVIEQLISTSLKRTGAAQPLTLKHRLPALTRTIAPIYIDINEDDFFGKAKLLNISKATTTAQKDNQERRNQRREQKHVEKHIRKGAELASNIVELHKSRVLAKNEAQRRYYEHVMSSDAAELKKSRTHGGSMDTSQGSYRANKKNKVRKGEHGRQKKQDAAE